MKRWNLHTKVIKGHQVVFTLGYYGNHRTAITIVDADDGEPIMKATVNIPDAEIEEDEVIIKNWSENSGILEWLQEEGIVGPTLREIDTGNVKAQVCKFYKEKV